MADPTFTILMPVLRPPVLMPFAIDSIQAQTRDDFELFIVGDGAPAETIDVARVAAAADPRIRVFPFPKGERRGEAHRHTVLEEARGRYVCQLADDDLWLPDHLQQMATHLAEVDFGNLSFISVTPEFGPTIPLYDLADPDIRARMQNDAAIFNMFGPSQSGYRLETYRRLPIGWSPAPAGMPTDLFMWRRFLALPGITVGTRFVITSVHLGDAIRDGWDLERRRQEVAHHVELLAQPGGREHLTMLAYRGTARHEAVKLDVWDHHRGRANTWQEAHGRATGELDRSRLRIAELEAQLAGAQLVDPPAPRGRHVRRVVRRLRRMAAAAVAHLPGRGR